MKKRWKGAYYYYYYYYYFAYTSKKCRRCQTQRTIVICFLL